jgi:hypothetical protein
MAKSLRASSKVKARNARRYGSNTDYAVTQAARLNALSQRLKERTKGPTVTEQDNQNGEDHEGEEEGLSNEDEDSKEVEESKGWYLCFEDGKNKRVEGSDTCNLEKRDGWGDDHYGVQGCLVDLELLGLIDPESIGLSDDDAVYSGRRHRSSPVEWMF